MADEHKLSGLRAIVGNTGTLHGIEAPPEREDFGADEAYARALAEYEDRFLFWHAAVKRLGL
jgi:hypothetical protein